MTILPTGKLPAELLENLLRHAPASDPRLILGPGVGLDCGVVQMGDVLLVFKAEPITFVSDQIGWYGVHVAVNDIATTGAIPRWMMVTLLLPEGKTTPDLVQSISSQIYAAADGYGITIVGGHTEITTGLDRPILSTMLIGEVSPDRLITPRGACPGDCILLSKSIPVEGTAILAREFPDLLRNSLSPEELLEAQNYIYTPGISVWKDARVAIQAGKVHAMHDPTEGGLATALWELAEASGTTLEIKPESIPVSNLSQKICDALELSPLGTIASGALLMVVPPEESLNIQEALRNAGIPCTEIGNVREGITEVRLLHPAGSLPMPRYDQDEITRAFQKIVKQGD